jgi:aspartate-semialdehyde dehydrogenase
MKPNVALFSAGGSTSLEWAPKFAEVGTRVVDNSSAWRMDSRKKLVVSEVNANVLTKEDYIIANPNCSTMQMLVVLAPLHKKYKIKRTCNFNLSVCFWYRKKRYRSAKQRKRGKRWFKSISLFY